MDRYFPVAGAQRLLVAEEQRSSMRGREAAPATIPLDGVSLLSVLKNPSKTFEREL